MLWRLLALIACVLLQLTLLWMGSAVSNRYSSNNSKRSASALGAVKLKAHMGTSIFPYSHEFNFSFCMLLTCLHINVSQLFWSTATRSVPCEPRHHCVPASLCKPHFSINCGSLLISGLHFLMLTEPQFCSPRYFTPTISQREAFNEAEILKSGLWCLFGVQLMTAFFHRLLNAVRTRGFPLCPPLSSAALEKASVSNKDHCLTHICTRVWTTGICY